MLESLLVSAALGPEASAQRAQGDIGKRHLEPVARALVDLSNDFTRRRDDFSRDYWRGPGRLAYLLYYLPINFAKAWRLLAELAAHPSVAAAFADPGASFKILDVGCGPGTATLATLFFLAECAPERPLSISATLTDRSSAALRDASDALSQAVKRLNCVRAPVTLNLRTHVGDLGDPRTFPPAAECDFVWVGNALNEVAAGDARNPVAGVEWLRRIVERFLAPHGSAVVFEPALRDVTRHVMRVRDALLTAAPGVNVFSPCTADGHCRMLAQGAERDWCHAAAAWDAPPLVKQLDDLTGLHSRALKFSYFILRRDGRRATDEWAAASSWRIVGDRLREKGKEKVLACGAERLATLTRLKRDRSPANAAYDRLQRGDILTTDAPLAVVNGDARITERTIVNVASDFAPAIANGGRQTEKM
jgi:ribosomal protein RSM22 (predicted rRNA methylase)